MAKKKIIEKKTYGSHLKKKESPNPTWAIPFILLITVAAYLPVLNAGFVNWDDEAYIINNALLKNFSNFQALITTPVQGNYHPLTMISLAINYSISGLDAWSYHLFNLILHLINSLLVYSLASKLSNQNFIIAFGTAILFAIHPMHVESVAWVSERKDVLYTLFFLAGLICYIKYVDTYSKKQFILSILFLILSLLSKPAAIVFPLVLFCIDLLKRRSFNFKLMLEKIPFLIPALIIGVLTYNAQSTVGATGEGVFSFALSTRVLMAFYGFMMYIIKLIFPFNLSPFYPFPVANMKLPEIYYIAPIFFIAAVILFFYSMKKNRVFAFGISFYFANLILVLQILPVGGAVIAERYSYVPYIGLFYIVAWLINHFTSSIKKKAILIILPVSILFSFLTYQQSGIWHSGATLWDHAIKTNPSFKAYMNRAQLLRQEKDNPKALDYYTKAIELNNSEPEGYTSRGNVYVDLKKYDLAYADYKKALLLRPKYPNAYDNIGVMFSLQEKYDSALIYLSQAINIKPDYKPAYNNRAFTYVKLQDYEAAIKDYQTYLTFEPKSADVYNSIGFCLRAQKKFQESLEPSNKAIEMNPQPLYFLNRSYSYFGLNNLEMAKKDAMKAKEGGIQIEENYAKKLGLD
jgi:Tfp pilus assembly protein PilF